MTGTQRSSLAAEPAIFGDERVAAGFSTRHGGVSSGAYRSLNVGLSTGDDQKAVEANRGTLFRSFGLDPSRVAIAGQVHGSDVVFVDRPGLFPGFDALVTDSMELALAITAADCAVVLLADPRRRVVGAAHAGWRGTAGRVVGNLVDVMSERGADVADLRAYVSPCISVSRFEVGEEVAEQFESRFVIRREGWEKPHIDLRGAIVDQLLESGIHASAIEVSGACTYDHPDYFSYRADLGTTGRMMGFIALRRFR